MDNRGEEWLTAIGELKTAQRFFDEAEPDFVIDAALRLTAAEERVNALIKQAKKQPEPQTELAFFIPETKGEVDHAVGIFLLR